MKRLLISVISLALCSSLAVSQQTGLARLNGTVLDIADAPIPRVQIYIENATNTFKVVSDEDGKFTIDLPAGKYEIRSDKMPGFAATTQKLSVETGKTAYMKIVPGISEEGVLCILIVTSGPTTKRQKRKRHR